MLADRVALALPAPVGRLTPAMLDWAAEASESEGEGRIVLAPWSAVIVPGVAADAAEEALRRSEAAGFTPVPIAQRLTVIACAGAPACPRASEPAKALGLEVLALASREPGRLPERPARLHLSACAKGCAGSAPADLLLLGSAEAGWDIHHDGAPRRPGLSLGRIGPVDAGTILRLVADQR
jgi:precorrin-3B synthase